MTNEQNQQSWAAWILDAYANSVVTGHEDIDDSDYSEALSPAMSEETNADSASPSGAYVRTGRGGAGNYQWQSQQQPDLEAQKPMSLKEKRKIAVKIESIDTAAAMRNAQSRNPSQYVRTGRGGAGNFGSIIQMNTPQPSPTAANFAKSPRSAGSPVVYAGRGGAGNLAAGRCSNEQVKLAKEKAEQAEAEKRREQAEQQVGSLLQPPTQAYIGARRRSALPEDFETLEEWH